MTNAPTNSSPEDIAQVASALDQAMQAAAAIQAQGTGTAMSSPSTLQPDLPGLLARERA